MTHGQWWVRNSYTEFGKSRRIWVSQAYLIYVCTYFLYTDGTKYLLYLFFYMALHVLHKSFEFSC